MGRRAGYFTDPRELAGSGLSHGQSHDDPESSVAAPRARALQHDIEPPRLRGPLERVSKRDLDLRCCRVWHPAPTSALRTLLGDASRRIIRRQGKTRRIKIGVLAFRCLQLSAIVDIAHIGLALQNRHTRVRIPSAPRSKSPRIWLDFLAESARSW